MSRGNPDQQDGKRRKGENMDEEMTKLELLTVMLSLKALLDENKTDKAKEVIDSIIAEAKKDRL